MFAMWCICVALLYKQNCMTDYDATVLNLLPNTRSHCNAIIPKPRYYGQADGQIYIHGIMQFIPALLKWLVMDTSGRNASKWWLERHRGGSAGAKWLNQKWYSCVHTAICLLGSLKGDVCCVLSLDCDRFTTLILSYLLGLAWWQSCFISRCAMLRCKVSLGVCADKGHVQKI